MHHLKDRSCWNKSESTIQLYRMLTLNIKTYRLKASIWGQTNHASTDKKKAGVAILISDRTDYKIRKVFRVKERHYVQVKRFAFQ